MLARFDALNRAAPRRRTSQSIFYYAVFYPVIEVLAALSGALIICDRRRLGARRRRVSLGVLVAFLQYSRRFFQPISDLSEKFNILQAAMAASERIFTLLDTPVAIVDAGVARTVRLGGARGRIEFDHVWFAYDGEHFVLRDVSFRWRAG